MNDIDINDILKAVGAGAAVIFAAWIFMGFLQQRYDAAIDRYREMIGRHRAGDLSDERRGHARDTILLYKRRCDLMNYAFQIGLVSAVGFLLSLILAEVNAIFRSATLLAYVSVACMLFGFILVIIAALLVMAESMISKRQVEEELLDISDLADSSARAGANRGDIAP
jgi:hypothetical protein